MNVTGVGRESAAAIALDLATASWEFREAGTSVWRSATVPGCVHTDLLDHDLIPDPFWGRNELDLQWIEERDWEYRCLFDVPPDVFDRGHIELVFEGLDTIATVTLNGALLLCSENMFHRHRVDIAGAGRAGPNELLIRFDSAARRVRETAGVFEPPQMFNDSVGGCVRLRKQQCQFGWDWGPRFVTAGVWRAIHLEAWSGNRIDGVRVEQRHEGGAVSLRLIPELALAEPDASFSWSLAFDGREVAEGEGLECAVPAPQLWWPAGQGAQPLYSLVVEHIESGSTWSGRIGLRTIALDMEDDGAEVVSATGRPLARMGFRVNGRLIFAKGANWIPAHSFVAGLIRADYEPLVRAAADANMNMLRVWGGGIYEHDAFYDLCDELGLLVWQDLMFACDLYPAHDAFLESVTREALDQARRIRHHAALALWCGNNEITLLNQEPLKQAQFADGYERLFLLAIPEALRQVDPATPYIHSSPAMGLPGRPASDAPSEDAHDWNVWHARLPVSHYEGTRHRFLSEFGMQSYPSEALARTFCPPDQLNVFSPVFDNHQKNRGGNLVILDYVARLFRFPKDYASLSYLSQLNQAHCMQVAIEHCRRLSPVCLGTLYWQLNDCWPAASWSGLEYGGGWKALHYAVRRAYAPTLLSLRQLGDEERILGNYIRTNTGQVEIHLVHDGSEPLDAELRWSLQTLTGKVLREGQSGVRADPLEARLLATLDFTADVERVGRERTCLRAVVTDRDRRTLSEATSFFAPPRALSLDDAPIDVIHDDEALILSSSAFHYGVAITGETNAWDNNYFHLFPGEPKRVAPLRRGDTALFAPRVSSLVHSFLQN